ncbi:heavy metal translocating P-type ATPase [Leptospira interrogans]|uniref:P-type Cu(+) transporter n=1 Tax=Leptospira interrogans serovar Hardjo str. Norma TaxID=1279460 RepID=A0A0M3TMK2_LEPIR|nr:heavy metal translocating P-type ATPase [Leptospira interrogans]ALE40981.1 cation transport ATPase [Leptospira interrogans serovar Hardjo str. Norma]ALO01728.1 cation transport ATPase [Leptospira interrogans serovar Hardjo-prajitno]EKO94693.1 copper-exporting ATPase [Leptospira interrogans str. Brem 329]MCD1165108.1 heavy metal translocating P-type ATPase [Leptospira interrogans]MCH1887594.1 heavy metal translocating P-type ATPase [Leptospira interrogans]
MKVQQELHLNEVTLDVIGMTCANCALRIEKGLKKIPGVKDVRVNFAMETAKIDFESSISKEILMDKIDFLGYRAVVHEDIQIDGEIQKKEFKKLKVRVIVSAFLSLPLLLSMIGHFENNLNFEYLSFLMNPWLQFILATPIQFWIGASFYKGSFRALRNGGANMDVLVVLGTSAAYFYSVYLTFIFNEKYIHKTANLYYETSSVLITLILFGKLLEHIVKGKSSKAIQSLVNLQPKKANVIREKEIQEIPLLAVRSGDLILVKPGESIPVDGIIEEGSSTIDESMLTGESIPVEKTISNFVYGGSLNQNGTFKFRALKVGKETLLSGIIRAVREAQGTKAPIQRIADQISEIFVPVIVLISVITLCVWYFWILPSTFSVALEKAIAVLVVACPCALGLATPISVLTGSGKAATMGILFRSAEALEILHKVNAIVFDKTGTLTYGKLVLKSLESLNIAKENNLLTLAASAEQNSEHPLSKAIVESAKKKGLVLAIPENFETIPGGGISAIVEGNRILIGTERLFYAKGIELNQELNNLKRIREEEGNTVVHLSVNEIHSAILTLADTLKESTPATIAKLKSLGIEVYMITGDNERTARVISKDCGIERVLAEVLPEKKAMEVKNLKSLGKVVSMVGDGINDAPALAISDLGIAMGTGTDVAMESSDLVIVNGDLNSIVNAITISRKTVYNIRQNFFWALLYNTLGIPIAAAGFLAPWVAGGAMALSSVSVVLNALRLQRD